MLNQYANPNYTNPYINQKPYPTYPQQNGIVWVQGIEGAKAYQLVPNSNAMLMDSESNNRFYIKVSDNVGMCTLRIFEYNEITNNMSSNMEDYVKKSDLRAEVENLVSSMIGGQSNEPTLSTVKSQDVNTQRNKTNNFKNKGNI